MEQIGFIGLGVMGKPMAYNLLKGGYPLVVYNRSQEPVEEVRSKGAGHASSPGEVAAISDVVITMLPDSPDVEEVVLGKGGIIEGANRGMLFIDMSTIAPASSQKLNAVLKKKKVASLDAPVSGGDVGAFEGTLSIMVGGEEENFKRALPIFKILGKNIVHMGKSGAGQVTKACNQVVVALTIQAISEALTLAGKSGVDPARVREVLLGGFAQSRILDLHGKRILDRKFDPGFKIRLHRKDLAIAMQAGREVSLPLSATAQVADMMNTMITRGMGEMDHSAMALMVEKAGN